jgi:hypothetical protein
VIDPWGLGIFGINPWGIGGSSVTEEEMARRHARAQQAAYALGYGGTYLELELANYRAPVHVPAGWSDWFAIGDEAV